MAMRLAVLVTCHNRRETTVASLRALQRSVERVADVTVQVFLTDDGSTDGTADAVRSVGIPLTVIQGSGQLFWNRGMVEAWRAADEQATPFGGYLLLNDDTVLDEHALPVLLAAGVGERMQAVVVGAVRDPSSGELTYGGLRRLSAWHPGKLSCIGPAAEVQDADTFNANCVLIPKGVRDVVGTLDPTFTHSMGDVDYGFRARKAGIRVVVAPGTVGTCSRTGRVGSWREPGLPMRERLRRLEGPKGVPRHEWKVFLQRHGAPLPWVLAWLPTLRAVGASLQRSSKQL